MVERLVAAGHSVRVLSRGTRSPGTSRPGVESVRGSVTDPSGLEAACAGCDAVVHLVGIIAEVRDQTFERVHVEGTRNLLAAASRAGVRRWVQMSALGTRPHAVAQYHQTKWKAEELVRASGLEWTVFRPSLVFGPGDGFVNFFERMSRWSPVLPLIGGGRGWMQPVEVGVVARCFADALQRPASIGRTYDVCGPERLTFRQILEVILEVTGRRRWLLPVPWAVAMAQGLAAEWVWESVLGRTPPLSRDQVRMLREDNVGDPGPMMRDFGVNPAGFREGIGSWLRPR